MVGLDRRFKQFRTGARYGPVNYRISKRLAQTLIESHALAEKIREMVCKAGVPMSEAKANVLAGRICGNKGNFDISMLADIHVYVDDHSLLLSLLDLVEKRNANGSVMAATLRFDKDMEAFFRRIITGIDVHMSFIRMRSKDLSMPYAMHVRFGNHWEFGRVIEALEQHEDKRKVLDGLWYHTAIDGVHLDCVPLYTEGLPVDWVMSVVVDDCRCGCANWARKEFIGGDWL